MRFVPPAGNGDRPADLAEFGLREVLESIAPSSGLLPDEIGLIGAMVRNICYGNAADYFGFDVPRMDSGVAS